jgi:hypothetical protein
MNMARIIIEGNLYIQICSDVGRVNRQINPNSYLKETSGQIPDGSNS